MARILTPTLKITNISTNAGTALCQVSCKIKFTKLEFNLIKLGLTFQISCTLLGRDTESRDRIDDHIFSFQTKFLPDTTPADTETIMFEQTIALSKLDEDKDNLRNADEVYARITVKDNYTLGTFQANTNIVVGMF